MKKRAMHSHYMTLPADYVGSKTCLGCPADKGPYRADVHMSDPRLQHSHSDSNNAFVHGGSRMAALAAIIDANPFTAFMPLPSVTNKWHSLSVEFKFYMTEKYGLAVGYRYEEFRVKDFATVNLADWNELPRIDNLGGPSRWAMATGPTGAAPGHSGFSACLTSCERRPMRWCSTIQGATPTRRFRRTVPRDRLNEG